MDLESSFSSVQLDFFSLIPYDLFQDILEWYFALLNEEVIDILPLPCALISLQLVSKRFYRALMRPKSLCCLCISNFQAVPGNRKFSAVVLNAVRESGTIPSCQWLMEALKYPVDECFQGAVRYKALTTTISR
jgi:hypothetical protein